MAPAGSSCACGTDGGPGAGRSLATGGAIWIFLRGWHRWRTWRRKIQMTDLAQEDRSRLGRADDSRDQAVAALRHVLG
jgi:hypothetical protein